MVKLESLWLCKELSKGVSMLNEVTASLIANCFYVGKIGSDDELGSRGLFTREQLESNHLPRKISVGDNF